MFGKIVMFVCLVINIMVFIKAMKVYYEVTYGAKDDNITDDKTHRAPMITTFTVPHSENENVIIGINQE